jgi:hypothetical protein
MESIDVKMDGREQPGGRWNDTLQPKPANGQSRHPEPERTIRRIRQDRRPGALLFGDCIRAMRYFEARLKQDADSYSTWIGLACLFESLADERRAGQCRGIARRLSRPGRLAATS